MSAGAPVVVRRARADVHTDNVAAVALYRKFGFDIEGTARSYALRNGAYVDAYLVARLSAGPAQRPPSEPVHII